MPPYKTRDTSAHLEEVKLLEQQSFYRILSTLYPQFKIDYVYYPRLFFLKPGFHIVFVGLLGSLWVAEDRWVCQSFTIAEDLSGSESLRVFLFLKVLPGKFGANFNCLRVQLKMAVINRRLQLLLQANVFLLLACLRQGRRPQRRHRFWVRRIFQESWEFNHTFVKEMRLHDREFFYK